MSDDLPDGWNWGLGEGNWPLSERGYYLQYAQKVIWANQHVCRYVEVRIDTCDMPPSHHVIQTKYFEDDDWEITELATLDFYEMEVEEPDWEPSQWRAEKKARAYAINVMERVSEGDFDHLFGQ